VKNPEGVNTGVKKVIVDGKVCDDGKVQLVNDKDTHKVEVYMEKSKILNGQLKETDL